MMTKQRLLYQKEWRLKNPDKIKKYRKKQYQNHPEHIRYKKEWAIKCKIYGLGVGTVARYGFGLSLQIYEKCDRKCVQCGEINDLTIHHLDGEGRHNEEQGLEVNNNPDNLIVLCRKCHGSIHGKEGGQGNKKVRKTDEAQQS